MFPSQKCGHFFGDSPPGTGFNGAGMVPSQNTPLLYSILFSRPGEPLRERLSILSPNLTPAPSSATLTPAIPCSYPSASAPRLDRPDPPLAPDYRVVNTGYSAISP